MAFLQAAKSFVARCAALWVVLIASSLAPLTAQHAYRVEEVPNVQLEDSTRFVTDAAGVLQSGTIHQVDRQLQDLRQRYGVECVVVLLPSIGQEVLEEYATDLFQHWGLGSSKDDSGILLIGIIDQRRFRIATGYGVEGVLPDALCRQIIARHIAPHFKEEDYDGGIRAAVSAVCQAIEEGGYEGAERTDRAASSDSDKQQLAGIIFFLFIVGVALYIVFFTSIRHTVHDDKLIGPAKLYHANRIRNIAVLCLLIFFPLAILFYIHYAVYRRKIMRLALQCPKCNALSLRELVRTEEIIPLLNDREQLEEQIRSVRYGGIYCDQCHYTHAFVRAIPYSKYSVCPECFTRAYYATDREHIRRRSRHVIRTHYKCLYCGHSHYKDEEEMSNNEAAFIGAIIGSSLTRGGRGGFGGGGFGGGSTGGGGASGGW